MLIMNPRDRGIQQGMPGFALGYARILPGHDSVSERADAENVAQGKAESFSAVKDYHLTEVAQPSVRSSSRSLQVLS